MCGVSGFYEKNRQSGRKKETLDILTNTLNHRGPDDSVCYIDRCVGLGMKRLSIMDLSPGLYPFLAITKISLLFLMEKYITMRNFAIICKKKVTFLKQPAMQK